MVSGLSFSNETEMYPVLREYFDRKGYKTVSQVSFRMIKGWQIDVAAYNPKEKELIAVEAKTNLEDALEAISQAEMYQMACSKAYVAFPQVQWDSRANRDRRRDIEEVCKKRGIGILKVVGEGLDKPCVEIIKPTLALRIDLLEDILHDIKGSFEAFDGFDESDFSYFFDNQRWKKGIIRKKLQKLITELNRTISTRASFLRKHKIGMQDIGKHYAGLNIFRGDKPIDNPHYSIGIAATENKRGFFSVFIQIPTKKLVKSFLKKLREDRQEFLMVIQDLCDVYIELFSRTSKGGGRPRRGSNIYIKILDIKASVITLELLEEFITLIENTDYPAINFSKEYLVETKGYKIERDDVINFIFTAIDRLKPIYEFISE